MAVASHIAAYVGSKSEVPPYADRECCSDHVVSGADETSGMRIIDTLCTIQISSYLTHFSLDIDFSEYDSSLRWGNFRKPQLEACHAITWDHAVYDPDNIPKAEMNEFAYGEGFVHGAYWDVGREPLVHLTDME